MKKKISIEGTVALVIKVGYNRYAVRFAIEPYQLKPEEHRKEGVNYVSYASVEFAHKPLLQEVREAIEAAHNADIADAIVNGLTVDGIQVALTLENQANFAAQLQVGSYPANIKIGSGYKEFADKAAFEAFYRECRGHIDTQLQHGRAIKEGYNWEEYRKALADVD